MVLTKAKKGNVHRIASIDANDSLLGKLAALGLVPGAEVEILQGAVHGASLVACKGAQFALGRGLADMIQLDD